MYSNSSETSKVLRSGKNKKKNKKKHKKKTAYNNTKQKIKTQAL